MNVLFRQNWNNVEIITLHDISATEKPFFKVNGVLKYFIVHNNKLLQIKNVSKTIKVEAS
jgi:hypothetical protein